MLFRRITKHVTEQNWFAVFIDFLIVVMGVFIGIQVANWNEKINNQRALSENLARLQEEVLDNISTINKIINRIDNGKAIRLNAVSIIQACEDSSDNEAVIIDTIDLLSGDITPTFLNNSLNELVSQERSLSQLSPEFRKKINTYQSRIDEEEGQIEFNFNLMWNNHVRNNIFIDADFDNLIDGTFFNIKLSKPISDICRNPDFRREFNNTMGFYDVIGQRLKDLRVHTERFSQTLKQEQKLQR